MTANAVLTPFRDEGKEEIKANEYSAFAGRAAKCSMYIDKLGAEGDDLLWQLSSDRPIYFWILKDAASGRAVYRAGKNKRNPARGNERLHH